MEKLKNDSACAVVIEDGVLDEVRYSNSDIKIMVLLKEPYGKIHENSIIQKFNQDNALIWDATYKTVAKWLYGVRGYIRTGEMPKYPYKGAKIDMYSESDGDIFNSFMSCALVNVKKTNEGNSTTKHSDVVKYVNENRALLMEQIESINPEIVLCGNTFGYYKQMFGKLQQIEKVENTTYLYRDRTRYLIDYWHPARRVSDESMYDALEEVLIGLKRELGQQIRCGRKMSDD